MKIPVNKKRFPILLIVSITISILFAFFISKYLKYFDQTKLYQNFFWGILLGIFISATIAAIISFLEFIKTRFDTNAAFTVHEKGVNDNLSIFSIGNICWSDIRDLKIKTVWKIDLLIIELVHPMVFIKKQNIFKRKILKSWYKKYGSPSIISQRRIEYDLNELKQILDSRKNSTAHNTR